MTLSWKHESLPIPDINCTHGLSPQTAPLSHAKPQATPQNRLAPVVTFFLLLPRLWSSSHQERGVADLEVHSPLGSPTCSAAKFTLES